jgi:patatin-like phospholipase/acyl hydrolase
LSLIEAPLADSNPHCTFLDKLEPSRQKKLLALDGGGIRGAITLEVLAAIEEIVRRKIDRPHAVLADYFDYIAGTSTGAIIATGLSLGMSVSDLRRFYVEVGPDMFSRAGVLRRFHYKFDQDRLAAQLKAVFGADTKLGSRRLRTLLMLVMRNATTDSPWPISNNPAATFNNPARSDCNLNLPLWQLVRASTAAPTYFPPEAVRVGDHEFLFVDGGVTMYNNPAFQLFLMTTLAPYKVQWSTGVDRMLLVSVGTGANPNANAHLRPEDIHLLYNASSIPSALMFAALNQQDLLCRVFGDCLVGDELDQEVGHLRGQAGPIAEKLFTYVRYSPELTESGLGQLGLSGIRPESVQALDSVEHIQELQMVGRALAERDVREAQFERF